jgi:hypothetical protein
MIPLRDDRGSVLILSLLVITLLGLVSVWSTQNSTTETTVSGNDKLTKISFYAADGGGEMGAELLEQNIDNKGFDVVSGQCRVGNVAIDMTRSNAPQFYLNTDIGTVRPDCTNRDVYTPINGSCNPPPGITNLRIGGNPALSTGGAIQMLAGYEGKGKGSAGGGAWVTYDIRTQHRNVQNAEAIVNLRWRHVL